MRLSERFSCYCGGGHAKVVIATARAAGYEVIGVLDEDETKHGKVILDVPIKADWIS